jgi:hypothetical protein
VEAHIPWKTGSKKTQQGHPILKKVGAKWRVVGHSPSKEKAKKSVRARYASKK